MVEFFASAPVAAGLWLVATLAGGWVLMRAAKIGLAETIRRVAESGGRPGGLLVFGKLWAVGALLFFPGLITDAVAAALMILPGGLFRGGESAVRESRSDIEARIVEDDGGVDDSEKMENDDSRKRPQDGDARGGSRFQSDGNGVGGSRNEVGGKGEQAGKGGWEGWE